MPDDERELVLGEGRPTMLAIRYPKEHWVHKGDAWTHLIRNPPEVLQRSAGISKGDNPYRKTHGATWDTSWSWEARVPS